MATTRKPVNYLNNRDLLKEIHLSKNSYCTFVDTKYADYDYIVCMPNETHAEWIESLELPISEDDDRTPMQVARINRANRLNIDIDEVEDSDLVFRCMTSEHIPQIMKKSAAEKKPASGKRAAKIMKLDDLFEDEDEVTHLNVSDPTKLEYVKLNFHPFQHFLLSHGKMVCVGKSHWIGDIDTGNFSLEKGAITKTLSKMFLLLCERYSMKFNWRGYSYVDEMRSTAVLHLTYVGLKFNEARSQNPFAFYTKCLQNSFRAVLNVEKDHQNIRDELLVQSGYNPSWSLESDE